MKEVGVDAKAQVQSENRLGKSGSIFDSDGEVRLMLMTIHIKCLVQIKEVITVDIPMNR